MVSCTECGEDENLEAEQTDDGINVRCGACGAVWPRDGERRCATCARTGLVYRPRPLTQFSRGTQLSIVGWVNLPCCPVCDADELDRSGSAGGPLRADYVPAARERRTSSWDA